MKLFLFLVTCCLAFNAHGVNPEPTKSGSYDIGGVRQYLECYENEHPTLILEQGFGRSGSDGVWLPNIVELLGDFSICLYDRHGLGKSEQGPVPVTVNDLAIQLHRLLAAANVEPPYYFAGGSYASNIITAFNNLYEKEVLGAVFIDPSPFGYFHTMGTRWPDDFETQDQQLKRYYEFEQSVHEPLFARAPEKIDHMNSYEQLRNAQNFGDKPVLVLRAKPSLERYDPPFVPESVAEKMDLLFENADEKFLQLSANAQVIYSDSDKHHLHIADRELVVETIKKLIQQ
ncbi:alpha/beta fold hydrolase [Alteromonas flava]|uniref:alpha/beta fold hydrolase n=1 Tax=Alteromonas flava TaxID=2048003 RepID=UPI000C28970B|nr:alpha/beta fold hydrolase [Alteromonas flava]